MTDFETPEDEAARTSPVGAPDADREAELSNGQRAFITLVHYLREDGWSPQPLEGQTIARVYYAGRNGDLRCYAQVVVDLEQFIFYVVAPVKAPEAVRSLIAEFITRANYGLRIGNFELDYSDGEVRFKSSLDFEGAELTAPLIRNTVYTAVQTMDLYLTGLLSVMYGNKTPVEAIEEIEG